MFKAIAGGIGIGALGGGLLGSVAGGEGGFGDGLVKGAMAGGLAGAGASSLASKGGILNNAMRSFGGMADDMLGNTSQKGYMRALDQNRGFNKTRSGLTSNVDDAQRRVDSASMAFELELQRVARNRGHDYHLKGSNVYNDMSKEAQAQNQKIRRGILNDMKGDIDPELDMARQGQNLLQESNKALTGTKQALSKFDASDDGMRRVANQKIIDEGKPTGSIEDFFYNLGGNARANADANIASYRKMSSRPVGELDDADYRSLMEMESSLGPKLSQSIRNSSPNQLNSKLAGYEQHVSSMQDNVASRNRAMVFGGAGLTGAMVGATSGKRKNHRRGMNSRRGARF